MVERPDLETREQKRLRLNTEIALRNLREQVDRIPALEAKIEDWREAWEQATVRADDAESRLATLARELGAAERERSLALTRYLRHDDGCDSIGSLPGDCPCGLRFKVAAAIAAAEGEP